jgi:hypothetical protein
MFDTLFTIIYYLYIIGFAGTLGLFIWTTLCNAIEYELLKYKYTLSFNIIDYLWSIGHALGHSLIYGTFYSIIFPYWWFKECIAYIKNSNNESRKFIIKQKTIFGDICLDHLELYIIPYGFENIELLLKLDYMYQTSMDDNNVKYKNNKELADDINLDIKKKLVDSMSLQVNYFKQRKIIENAHFNNP